MRAWRVHDFGEPADVLVEEDVPEPTAADLAQMGMSLGGWVPLAPEAQPYTDWVLMRMRVAALALPDVTMARGTYPVPVVRPYTTGQEGVGTVIDASPSRRHLLAKRVVACTIQPWGGLAEVAVGVGMIFEAPDEMSDEQAAAYVIAGHTGYHAAIRRGGIQAGETAVVLGASGGIGASILQLCVARGARVLAVVGGQDKAELCRELGAEPIDHTAVDFVAAIREATGGHGADVIMDPVQGEMGARAREALAHAGRHVLCGHAGGLIPHDPQFYVYNQTLVGCDLGGYGPTEMLRMHREAQDELTRLIAEGSYRPLVGKVIEFDDVPAALTDQAARKTSGRVVVRIP